MMILLSFLYTSPIVEKPKLVVGNAPLSNHQSGSRCLNE